LGEGFINGTAYQPTAAVTFGMAFDFARFVDYRVVFFSGCSAYE
jgi:hypothetical protein